MFALGYQERQELLASQEPSLKAGFLGQSESTPLFAMTVADSSPKNLNVHLSLNIEGLSDSLQPQGSDLKENSG